MWFRSLRSRISIALVLGVFATWQSVSATSCVRREDRYFLVCREGTCESAFRVAQVNAFGTCARRSKVMETEVAAGQFLVPLLQQARPHANGLFALNFSTQWWHGDDENAFRTLKYNLDLLLPREDQEQARSIVSMPPIEAVKLLDHALRSAWIVQVSVDPSPETLQGEKKQLEHKANLEHWRSLMRAIGWWSSFLIVLAALVHSIHLFFFRLHSRTLPPRRWALLVPVATQASIGGAGVAAFFVAPFEFWPGSVLIPAVVVILLAEGWAKFRKPARARTKDES
jgi:hypothetical protein